MSQEKRIKCDRCKKGKVDTEVIRFFPESLLCDYCDDKAYWKKVDDFVMPESKPDSKGAKQ